MSASGPPVSPFLKVQFLFVYRLKAIAGQRRPELNQRDDFMCSFQNGLCALGGPEPFCKEDNKAVRKI